MSLRWIATAALLASGVLCPLTAMASVGPESDTDDVYWDDAFMPAGIGGVVYAIAKDGAGNIYVGGQFTTAGSVSANNIAKWNGSAWTPLGSGVNGSVSALTMDSAGNLYAGGIFSTAGGVPANYVAKWDGSAWTPLGSGTDLRVNALAADSAGNLYAGGHFTSAGGVAAARIAKWDGSAWTPLGSGLGDTVFSLTTDNAGNVYAGGNFSVAGSDSIAKWDGSAWLPLGSGTDSTVTGLVADNSGHVYAGGYFATAGGVAAAHIARWDGSTWEGLGSGLNSSVNSLRLDSAGNLYAGGTFTTAGGVSANCVAKWDGATWATFGAGTNAEVHALILDNAGNVYVAGAFTRADGVGAGAIARWDGSAWTSCGGGAGVSASILAVAADGAGNVYAGGSFLAVGGVTANYIAKWDGAAWAPLGSGMDSMVPALATDSVGNVYAGGNFTTAGGVAVNRVAKWDGVAWSPLDSGLSNVVQALAMDKAGNLYAGLWGGVWKWDGSTWTLLGGGMNGYVLSVTVDDAGNVYAGGQFTTAGGVTANNIAKWDGSAWTPLGSGLLYTTITYVLALATDSAGNLYAGGQFSTAGGLAIKFLAKWDGSTWAQIGSGVNGGVLSVVVDRADNLYVGGGLTTAGGVTVNRIAKWDGAAWSAMGSGTNSQINSLAVNRNTLFAGGYQAMAGGKPSLHFSVWQPRVNQSSASFSETPGAKTLGNDVYGFYKPALTTDASMTVAYAGGLPVDVTLNRADEIQVGGIRINGAFTLGPEDVEFGGSGATLRVEFSEDDAAAFGVAYTEFRAAKLTYPSDYPTNKEAATVTALGPAQPEPIRIENGKQIYAISVPLTAIGSTYGAAPQSLIAPAAPTDPGALVGKNAIVWTWAWTDHSNGEAAFHVFADPGAGPPATLRATMPVGAVSWRYDGLTPNCRYAFQAAATNGLLDSVRSINLARYTVAGPPSIGNNIVCNRSVDTPYGPGATCGFTNPAGFGVSAHGGSAYKVSRFGYAWDNAETHVFSGGESLWNSGALEQSPIGSGAHYLHLQSLNADGYPSETLDYGPFVFDLDAPTGSVAVSGDTGYCNSVNVALAITYGDGAGSGVSQMQFSNDGLAWSGWEAAASSKAWTLPAGDDTKTVYVQFKDAVGNVSEGISATVILDTIEPVFSDLAVLPAIAAEDEVVTLTFTVSEALLSPPEVTVNGHEAEEAGGKAGSSYAYTYVVQDRYQDPAGPAEIVVSGYDLAGNLGAMSSVNALTIEQQASHVPAAGVLGLAALTALLSWAFIRNATCTKSRAQ